MKQWMRTIKGYDARVPICIVGTKIDKESSRRVGQGSVHDYVRHCGISNVIYSPVGPKDLLVPAGPVAPVGPVGPVGPVMPGVDQLVLGTSCTIYTWCASRTSCTGRIVALFVL